MLLRLIESEGLAHRSYIAGAAGSALVVDPRRDCAVYADIALEEGMRITHVLETHRNEDYVSGSVELASMTGADVWHADSGMDYRYGRPVGDGGEWMVGPLLVRALATPGHTPGSVSYLLHDPGGEPWACFTGDTLFAGDVGRTDLMGMERAREMTGMLHDSLHGVILPLGDGVLVCPAHGPGSPCGSSISGRPVTTVGMERRANPALALKSREEFVEVFAVEHERPPYFGRMERVNLEGAPPCGRDAARPQALSPAEVAEVAVEGNVVDTRSPGCYGASHVPGSQHIWHEGLASYAGWYLEYDRPMALVSDNPRSDATTLLRMGYDDVVGFLAGGMLAWNTAGRRASSIRTDTVRQACRRLDSEEEPAVLDVRSSSEVSEQGAIEGSLHIPATRVPERWREVPEDDVMIFCGSGMRSMVAASLLAARGRRRLSVVMGGLSGWSSTSCPVVSAG